MEDILTGIGAFFLVILFIVLYAFVIGFFVMLLWNWLMPMLFGLKTITYIEGWGLSFLCGLLFKSSNSSRKD